MGGIVFTPITCGLVELCIDDLDDASWEASRKEKEHDDQEVSGMPVPLPSFPTALCPRQRGSWA